MSGEIMATWGKEVVEPFPKKQEVVRFCESCLEKLFVNVSICKECWKDQLIFQKHATDFHSCIITK